MVTGYVHLTETNHLAYSHQVHLGNLAQVYVPLADEPTRMMGSKGVGLSVDEKPPSVPASPRKDNLLPKRLFEQNKLAKSAPQLDARALITSDMIGAL